MTTFTYHANMNGVTPLNNIEYNQNLLILLHMKKIEAIIKPFKLDETKDALEDLGIENIIISDVRLVGQRNEKPSIYEGGEYVIDALPKTKIEFLLDDSKVDDVLEHISSILSTGRNGDGYLSVYNIDSVVHFTPSPQ